MTLLDTTHSQKRSIPFWVILLGILIAFIAMLSFFAGSDVKISQQSVTETLEYNDLQKN